jgi:hypothetical protein
MKKVLLTLTATVFAVSVFAQGTVFFNNAQTGSGIRAPVYGPEVGAPTVSKTGNTATGLPAGTTTYTGALLAGGGYLAQILAGNGAGASVLVAASTAPTTFRTANAAGFFAGGDAILTGVPAGSPVATVQVVAWDNASGQYGTWALAEAAWNQGLIAAGKSLAINVNAIGGGEPPNPSALLAGLQSFNIYFVPEPSTMALAGLGAAALLIFRRRK